MSDTPKTTHELARDFLSRERDEKARHVERYGTPPARRWYLATWSEEQIRRPFEIGASGRPMRNWVHAGCYLLAFDAADAEVQLRFAKQATWGANQLRLVLEPAIVIPCGERGPQHAIRNCAYCFDTGYTPQQGVIESESYPVLTGRDTTTGMGSIRR